MSLLPPTSSFAERVEVLFAVVRGRGLALGPLDRELAWAAGPTPASLWRWWRVGCSGPPSGRGGTEPRVRHRGRSAPVVRRWTKRSRPGNCEGSVRPRAAARETVSETGGRPVGGAWVRPGEAARAAHRGRSGVASRRIPLAASSGAIDRACPEHLSMIHTRPSPMVQHAGSSFPVAARHIASHSGAVATEASTTPWKPSPPPSSCPECRGDGYRVEAEVQVGPGDGEGRRARAVARVCSCREPCPHCGGRGFLYTSRQVEFSKKVGPKQLRGAGPLRLPPARAAGVHLRPGGHPRAPRDEQLQHLPRQGGRPGEDRRPGAGASASPGAWPRSGGAIVQRAASSSPAGWARGRPTSSRRRSDTWCSSAAPRRSTGRSRCSVRRHPPRVQRGQERRGDHRPAGGRRRAGDRRAGPRPRQPVRDGDARRADRPPLQLRAHHHRGDQLLAGARARPVARPARVPGAGAGAGPRGAPGGAHRRAHLQPALRDVRLRLACPRRTDDFRRTKQDGRPTRRLVRPAP